MLVGALLVSLAVTSCSTISEGPQQLDDWHRIALPGGMVPSSLAITGSALLIGGSVPRGDDRTPALALLRLGQDDAAPSTVPLTPATPYGKLADLASLTADGDTVVALGAAHGGAHANARWTIWTGSTSRLIDRPQTFETFGGWEAGTLLGLATDAQGPLLVGTWNGKAGQDGAVWRSDGDRWIRQPTAAAWTSTAQRQVAPRTVSPQGDGTVVVNGSVIDLVDGVHQSAAIWRDRDGDWTSTALPDPGARSEAWSTACSARCWSAGGRDGVLAVWTEDRREPVPDVPVTDTDTARLMLWRDRVVVVASSAGVGRVMIRAGDRWRTYTAPDGVLSGATLVGTELYLVTGTDPDRSLWVRDLADVLDR